MHAGLGRGVVGLKFAADQCGDGGDRDDRPAMALLHHLLRGRLHHEIGAVQIDAHRPLERLDGHVEEGVERRQIARLDLEAGEQALGVTLTAPVAKGHKVAVKPIAAGEPVLKFGFPIGVATRDIAPGEEITLDYISSWHDDETKCYCGAPGCRGTINKL